MFTQADFDVFSIEGLEPRMAGIRRLIQPKFQILDDYFVSNLEKEVGHSLPVHIAQHRQRRAHAPDYTWSAMGGDNRGYKKYPHFTLGINADFITLWLSFIDNPVGEEKMAALFLENKTMLTALPSDFVINLDHTKNNYLELNEENTEKGLIRWRDVKKGEFQLGRIIKKENSLLADEEKARAYMLETYQKLVPFYLMAIGSKTN